jgi:hypothetical protein
VRDERAQHAEQRLGAVLRDLLDDLARAQTDDGQRFARARNGPVRNSAFVERGERRAADQGGGASRRE